MTYPLGTRPLVQEFCTLRDLDELGIAAEAIAAVPVRVKRRKIRHYSGEMASALRPRHTLPLVVGVEDLDVSLLSSTATVVLSGEADRVADVAIRIVAGGAVSGGAVTYQISRDAGIDDSWGAVATLPSSGIILLDGLTITVAGTVAADDLFSYSAGVDTVVAGHTAALVTGSMLDWRGLDPASAQTLERAVKAAQAWMNQIKPGDRALATDADSTPDVSEMGPMGTGESTPFEWLEETEGT
jgi:hypothetical protein